MTVPAPITWVDDIVYLASDYNTEIRDAIGFLLHPPTFYGQSVGLSTALTTSVWTPIPINTELINSEGAAMHSNVTNNTRINITHEGWWDFIVQGSWVPSSLGTTGRRIAGVRSNGTTQLRGRKDATGGMTTTQQWAASPTKATSYLVVGDYVELVLWHDAGASTHTIWNNAEAYPFIAAKWRSK